MSNDETRYRALELILEAREHARTYPRDTPRIFVKPGKVGLEKVYQINFDAENILDILDFENLPQGYITEPPLLKDYRYVKHLVKNLTIKIWT